MINFRNAEISDKEWFEELTGYSGFRCCLYSFSNNFCWNMKIARYKNLVVSEIPSYGFTFPAGKFGGDTPTYDEIKEIADLLGEYSRSSGTPLRIFANKENSELLRTFYGERLKITPQRDSFDYIYNVSDLASLAGKKYHGKRNHLNRFKDNNHKFELITEENLKDCRRLSDIWRDTHSQNLNPSILRELNAINKGLDNFFALRLKGGILYADGQAAAFTYGSRLSPDTFDIQAEKAVRDVQGAYTAVNYCFANVLLNENYRYINREEDMGYENLRKSKLSYHPAFLEERYYCEF
jgi:hypothetical protein